MSQTVNDKWVKYIKWLLTPEHLRGSVTSDAAWARANKVTDRTLRRWRSLDEFQQLYDQMADVSLAESTAEVEEVETAEAYEGGDEADYRVVKSALVNGAKSGNPKYLDLYFRTYGKPFVEEEVASRNADLSSLDLDKLVAETLVALDENVLITVMAEHGWSVSRSGDDAVARV